MSTCPRNLPQHFNGCTCARTQRVAAESSISLASGRIDWDDHHGVPVAETRLRLAATEVREAVGAVEAARLDYEGTPPIRVLARRKASQRWRDALVQERRANEAYRDAENLLRHASAAASVARRRSGE